MLTTDVNLELLYLLNVLRCINRKQERPLDRQLAVRHLTALITYVNGDCDEWIDVLGACRETLANPVQE